MEDIVSQTGVSRYELCGTFGNKKELLIAAIRHCDETMRQLLMASLQNQEASRPPSLITGGQSLNTPRTKHSVPAA